jgi:DNA-binding transcriptional LysR family regulator
VDAGDLRVFEAVARLGGMNRAALELHTVQSTFTSRIRALETELGTPLFGRHARGVSLTAAGQRLLPYAERVRSLLHARISATKRRLIPLSSPRTGAERPGWPAAPPAAAGPPGRLRWHGFSGLRPPAPR